MVLLPQFGVVGSGSILLSQHCNNKSLKKEIVSALLRAKIFRQYVKKKEKDSCNGQLIRPPGLLKCNQSTFYMQP